MISNQDIQTIKRIVYDIVEEFFTQDTYKEAASIDKHGMWLGSYAEKIQIHVPSSVKERCFINSSGCNHVGIFYVHDEVQTTKLRNIANDIMENTHGKQ